MFIYLLISLRICSLFCNLFSFCSSALTISIVLSSNAVILLLYFTYYKSYCIFHLQNLFGFLLHFLFIDWYFFYSHIFFSLTFPTSSIISVTIFKAVVLMLLFNIFASKFFSGTVSVDLFFPLNSTNFYLFLSMSLWVFLLNTGHLNLLMW